MKKGYFSLYEIALLSLLGALIFVLKIVLKLPIHVPGHSGIFWIIPLILGVAIVKKPGAGIYMGLISGILTSFFGMGALHVFDIFEYVAIGFATDICGLIFSYRFENPFVSVLTGICANLLRMAVNYSVQLLLGVQGFFIILGIGLSSVSNIIFGGLGGFIAAYLIRKLIKAGVIEEDETG